MGKRLIVLGILAALMLAAVPSVSSTEDLDAVRLARVIYAMAGRESDETQLCVAQVAVNRVISSRYPDTLEEVLTQKHQFPMGERWDERSLASAKAALSGAGALPKDVTALAMGSDGRWVFYVPEICDIPI